MNANQRYATSAITHSVLKVIADAAGVPLQVLILMIFLSLFIRKIQKVTNRNDVPCGSTVGPILAAGLGIQTVSTIFKIFKIYLSIDTAHNGVTVGVKICLTNKLDFSYSFVGLFPGFNRDQITQEM